MGSYGYLKAHNLLSPLVWGRFGGGGDKQRSTVGALCNSYQHRSPRFVKQSYSVVHLKRTSPGLVTVVIVHMFFKLLFRRRLAHRMITKTTALSTFGSISLPLHTPV